MAPNPKVVAAYRAMAALGIPEVKVKPVLKKLLKLYDKNWELIEEENYRALADAIFEEDEKKEPEKKKKSKNVEEEEMEDEEAQLHCEPTRPLKRLCLRGLESQPSHPPINCAPSSTASPLKRPKLEDNTLPETCSRQQPQSTAVSSDGYGRIEAHPLHQRNGIVEKGKQPVSPHVAPRGRRFTSERASPAASFKEPTVEPQLLLSPKTKLPSTQALIKPKDEPIDNEYEVPLAVVPPEPSSARDSSMKNGAARKEDGHVNAASQCRDEENIFPSSNDEVTSEIEIASSPMGEVKISLSCSSALGGPDFHLPSRDQLLEKMEEKCLRSYKITDPNFSVQNFLRDMCDCILEFGTDATDDSHEGSSTMEPSIDVLKESEANGALIVREDKDLDMLSGTSNGSINVESSGALVAPRIPFPLSYLSGMDEAVLVSKRVETNDFSERDDRNEPEDPMSPNSLSLVVVPQHQLTVDDIRSFHDVNDLTKGEESVKISWVNRTTNDFLSLFRYIPQNLVFQDAYVNIALSLIGVEDCCSTCTGNCVLPSTPCACANKNGGEFAYTAQGLLKEEFLEDCIAINRNPQQHYFYCKDCPLERLKNDDCLEPCKGHLRRKFIKECWSKCSCGKQCGNRVVQRGITCNLQVFFTSEGKGWGLRTLEDLPKGAFVCEFVGEILTIKELHERNTKCSENGKHTCPIILDADWDSGVVKDEEALCLDAASYGNVARFINHRCLDANLVEIPVEVESPDHHYYHFAFFTSRKIAAQEELTWDYGIDFDDHDHPVKLFWCNCGSKFCRNMKRSKRSIRSAFTAR